MKRSPGAFAIVLLTTSLAGSLDAWAAESTETRPAATKAQQALEQGASEQKYTFIMFYKDDSAASRSMAELLKGELGKRPDEAIVTFAKVTNPAEKPLVDRFGVSRAPMPLTLAVAPNGAVTGILPQKVTAEAIEDAFVTPTMMRTMKSLQEGKLVLVCVEGTTPTGVPSAVKEFQADPHFKDRLATVSFKAADPDEGKFMHQMQLDAKATSTKTVLLAPPGVLVGKFDYMTTKNEIAAKLAQAGKCCDDPNCKHNHHQPQQQVTRPRATTQPKPRTN